MGAKISRLNYNNMIQALIAFAKNTGQTCRDLSAAANQCTQDIGEEDQAVEGIAKSVQGIAAHYADLAQEALRIAELMKNELKKADEESRVWNSDD